MMAASQHLHPRALLFATWSSVPDKNSRRPEKALVDVIRRMQLGAVPAWGL
jgi:hypothetical protein